MQNLECEMLELMSKLQKLSEESIIKEKEAEEILRKEVEGLKKSHEYKVGQVVLDYEIKLKDLKEANEGDVKEKLEKLEQHWKEKLENKEAESAAILKECQEISEYSIIQCELEKKEIQKLLDKEKMSGEALKIKYDKLLESKQELEASWETKEQELNSKIDKLTGIIKEKDEVLAKLQVEVKAYQVTISSSQVTIEVLKRRLIDSDRDVEQLKLELSKCETKLLDYESKHFHLTEQLKESQQCIEDLELQYNSSCVLNQGSINKIKEKFTDQVDHLKEQVRDYSKKIDAEACLKNDIMQQLNDNIETMKKINSELQKAEETLDILSEENDLLKEEVEAKEKIIGELKQTITEREEVNKELNDKFLFYKDVLEEYEQEASESSQTRKKYIEISGKYDSLLQDFETVEMENRRYKSEMESLTKKLEHLLTVQDQFEKVKKDKDILESENLFYKTKLEEQKLKKHYKLAAKDKENIGSPNRSVVESPNRGSPFRERN
ncbi:uncharacterized protein LOC126749484 isoform X2 [Anthonomus grandis grandis]|nr:uncharacterized protein LOC126749484 isoform X2 [Anthonomus grandis grandis]